MGILPQIFFFIFFVFFGSVLPGILLTLLFMKRLVKTSRPEVLCAISLLSGLIFQISLWAALRCEDISYNAVSVIHIAVVLALAFTVLREKERREEFYGILKYIFSSETAVFLALAVAIAAYLTYDKVQLYYHDELFRMSLARAAQKSIPLQNMFVWTGGIKYYYAAEFYAGSVSAITKIPLETVYFRFMLPFNWLLLFFGMKGILGQYNSAYKRYIPHAAFLILFLSHVKMLVHFTFRQNTFALGLAVLAMSALWTALSLGAVFPLFVCGAAPAFLTCIKAPFGALYLTFFCLAVILGFRAGLITWKRGAAAILFGIIAWFTAYRSLAGQGFQGAGSLFEISTRPGWLREFLPEYILNPGLLDALAVKPGYSGGVLIAGLQTLENVLTVLVAGMLPLIAAVFCLYPNNKSAGAARIALSSAIGVFITGAFIFCFIHYRISNGSDSYWLFFSVWMLEAAAYPIFLADLNPRLLPRLIALCALVPLVNFIFSLSVKYGHFEQIRGMMPWWLPAWILSAAAYPLFAAELNPSTFRRRVALLAIIPFLVALSQAPKCLYWAAGWKTWNTEGWTQNNQEACDVFNSRAGSDKVYLHNILGRYCLTMAAMCRGRMYASYCSGDGVWEDAKTYSAALADAGRFFNGETGRPCGWLKERSIGYIYWDKTGSAYKFPEVVKSLKFLSKIYDSGNAALYAVGPCAGDAAAGNIREVSRTSK